MLNEGRRGVKGKVGREGRKSGGHSPSCVRPFQTITVTSSSSSSKEPGLLTGRWTNGQMAYPI